MKNIAFAFAFIIGMVQFGVAQTTTINIPVTFPNAALTDFTKFRLTQFRASSTTGAAVTPTATTITTNDDMSAALPATGLLMIESEVIPYQTAGNGFFTVTRPAGVAHPINTPVSVLRYNTDLIMLKAIVTAALQDTMTRIAVSLGQQSTALGSALATEQAAAAALDAAKAALAQ